MIFDLDETLTWLMFPWEEWIVEVLAEFPHGVRGKLSRSWRSDGVSSGPALNDALSRGAISYEKLIAITTRFERRNFRHTPNAELVRAARELHGRGVRLDLWTGNVRSTARRALTDLNLLALFDHVVCREDTFLGKPDPEGLGLLGVSPPTVRQFLLVGDSSNDEAAARAVGMDFFPIFFFKSSERPATSAPRDSS